MEINSTSNRNAGTHFILAIKDGIFKQLLKSVHYPVE